MKRTRFVKYAGVIALLLFLAASMASALSSAERTAGPEAAVTAGEYTTETHAVGRSWEEASAVRGGIGTIAMGAAIAEAALIAVAASQTSLLSPK